MNHQRRNRIRPAVCEVVGNPAAQQRDGLRVEHGGCERRHLRKAARRDAGEQHRVRHGARHDDAVVGVAEIVRELAVDQS